MGIVIIIADCAATVGNAVDGSMLWPAVLGQALNAIAPAISVGAR